MAYPFEIAIDPGATDDEVSVRVLYCLSGGQPSAVAQLDIATLLAACQTLEDTVQESVHIRNGMGKQQLQNVGQQLFEAVFSGDIGSAYRSSYAVASDRNDKLRVVLRLSDPRLASLPWEAMYDHRNDEYVCRNEPLVRHVEAKGVPDPLEVESPLRILGLVSSPSDMPELAVDDEKARLSGALAGLVAKGLIHIEWVERPDWESVHTKLRDETWHVVHFTGHGEYDAELHEGTIALVDVDGRSHMVDADRFADLLNQGSSRPRLVVLNSCQSGRTGTRDVFSSSAATLVRRGTSAVAAMQFTVSDEAAVTFARGFYDSLSRGQTIDQAVQSGRISILGGGSLEWVTPVLYVRGDTSRLFDLTPPVGGPPLIVDGQPPADGPPNHDVDGPSPASADEQKKGPKIWARPLVWLAGVIVAAIGIAITNTIVPRLTEVIDVIPERGDPIRVNDVHTYWSEQTAYSVAFPDDMPVTETMWSTINSLDGIEANADWLAANGGSVVNRVYITVAVAGNREDGVRIVDVRPIAKCSAPLTGTLFYAPAQGRDSSIRLQFDLDQADPKPTYRNESDEVFPYFPENTISLKKDEQQILQIDAGTDKQSCSFTLELTILEGNERKRQTIYNSGGQPFKVSAFAWSPQTKWLPNFAAYDEIYMRGWMCRVNMGERWVRSPKPYGDHPGCP
jgi:hypothetical protein